MLKEALEFGYTWPFYIFISPLLKFKNIHQVISYAFYFYKRWRKVSIEEYPNAKQFHRGLTSKELLLGMILPICLLASWTFIFFSNFVWKQEALTTYDFPVVQSTMWKPWPW